VDITQTVNHISLCSGYGGIDLGLKRAIPGLRTIAFSEIEAYACANLVAKMEKGLLDAAPIWTNLKTFQSFVEKWTSCLEVTLVSPSQHQENDLEQKIQDTSGLTLQMELDSCDQTFAFLKTSKDILPLDSEKLLASWKQSVIEQRGEYSAREKLEHRTEENEFLSWPTPTASDITGPNPTQLINGSFKSKHSLNPNSPWYGARLKDAVMSYSTPTARMWKDTGTMPAEFRRNTPSLAIQVGGKLNADWVEWLMGIPTGWTDCDCAATALSQQLPH